MLKKHARLIVRIVIVVFVLLVLLFVLVWLRRTTSLLGPIPGTTIQINPNLGEDVLQGFTPHTLNVPDTYKQGVFTDPRVLNMPTNFQISVFADGMNTPRFFTFDDQGRMYVAEMGGGRIVMLSDDNGDGVADAVTQVDVGLNSPSSVFYYKGDLYVGETNQIDVYHGINDGKFSGKEVIIPDLPTEGHATRTVIVGPDNMLYVSIGSSCNLCQETDQRRAAVVRYELDGTQDSIFASGLRNSVGLFFHKNAKGEYELWSVDNGRDNIGDDIPPDEVNILYEGSDYGWPYCYGQGIANPEHPESVEYCQKQTLFPTYDLQAHSAPLDLAFGPDSTGNFPTDLQNNVFITFHGSWNRTVPTGYKVVRINTLQADAKPADFITGWEDSTGNVWGRPVGIGFDAKGVMYISDDKAGAVYRVTYAAPTK